MIEAIIFDLDDTLHDDIGTLHSAAKETAIEIADRLGVSSEVLTNAFLEACASFWKTYDSSVACYPASPRSEMWLRALRSVGIDDARIAAQAASSFDSKRVHRFQPFPGVVELLDELRTYPVRLGLLTNGLEATHREKIAVLGFESHFDDLVLSDAVGLAKPDVRIFLLACERLGVSQFNSVMVGDRYERDISGAIETGMQTIWFNPTRSPLPNDAAAPSCTVPSIDELREAILQMLAT